MSHTSREPSRNPFHPLNRSPALALFVASASLAGCAPPTETITAEPVAHIQAQTLPKAAAKAVTQPRPAAPSAHHVPHREIARAATVPKKEMGVAVSARFLNAPGYKALIKGYDTVVPENEAKMDTVIPSAPKLQPTGGLQFTYHFEGMDSIMSLAAQNGQKVRGHAMVYGGQTPKWQENMGRGCEIPDLPDPIKQQKLLKLRTFFKNVLSATIHQYAQTFSERYPGKIKEWDVVNEPVADNLTGPVNDGQLLLEPNAYQQCLPQGPNGGYIDLAFNEARQANPDAKLYINEIGAEFPSPRQQVLYNLVRNLRARNVPIDGVGFQGHFRVGDLPSIQAGELDKTLANFARLGVEERFTEVDVSSPPNPTVTDFNNQQLVFKGVAEACMRQRKCKGLVFWAPGDAYSWQPGGSPTLRDFQGRPKPAYDAVRRILGH